MCAQNCPFYALSILYPQYDCAKKIKLRLDEYSCGFVPEDPFDEDDCKIEDIIKAEYDTYDMTYGREPVGLFLTGKRPQMGSSYRREYFSKNRLSSTRSDARPESVSNALIPNF